MISEAVQRVIDHIERHKGRERAMFSIAGLQAVLEENNQMREALHQALGALKALRAEKGSAADAIRRALAAGGREG